MTHTIPVKKENYYKAVLMTMSPYIGGLTDYETNLLSEMLKCKIETLSTDNRRKLVSNLKTDIYTLNNYIKRLRDKGTLVATNSGLGINPNLTDRIDDKQITIRFSVS